MTFTVATWNINSVRLRIGLVTKLLERWKPDVLCLQETKCPQGQFPSGPIRDMGYEHIAEFGQKGYHGVAIVARRPFAAQSTRPFCGKDDCRHISVTVAGSKPVTIHNLYVPAGGDEPDPKINDKFAHKLQFIEELEDWFGKACVPQGHDGIVVGDLNIAPLEHDVWSHKDLLKVVSHTPIETDGLLRIQKKGSGWTSCASTSLRNKSSTLGGATGRAIGKRATAAAVSTISGRRRTSRPDAPASKC